MTMSAGSDGIVRPSSTCEMNPRVNGGLISSCDN